MNRQYVAILIGLGCLSASTYLLYSQQGKTQILSAAELRRPFQVEVVETHTVGAGLPRISLITTTMRNGAGDLRVDLNQTIGLRLREIRVKRQDQIEWIANPDTRLRRTVRHPHSEMVHSNAARPSPTKQCAASELGTDPPGTLPQRIEVEEIKGLQTFKLTFGEGRVVWRAPALGCTDVQRRQAFVGQNGYKARSDMDLATYSFEEPLPASFEPDATWAEVPPTALLQAWVDRNKFATSEVEPLMKQYRALDRYYHSHRP